MAITTEEASRPDRLSWWVAVVEAGEDTVADEHADGLAVGTGGLLEPLNDGDPFFLTAVEPGLVAHGVGCLR
jgi:hypothetical protein